MAPIDNGDMDAGFAGQFGGAQLREHASASQRTGTVALRFERGRDVADYAPKVRFFVTVGSHESINIGEEQEPIGVDRGGEQRAEFIVVAEGAFEFADGDTVILVDDGHDTQCEQLRESVLQIAVAYRRCKIVTREQKLGYDLFAKKYTLVGVHEPALPDGGTGLHAGNVGGTLTQRESGHAGGDCARGDNQVFVMRKIELIDETTQKVDVDPAARGNEAGSDFDYDAHSVIAKDDVPSCR